jgi:hypothetical protein
MEEPYYRIFFADDELLSLYTNGKINAFPTHYNYGSELMPKILKAIVAEDETKLVENLERLSLLEPVDRLRMLIGSGLVGDVELACTPTQTPGEKVLRYFQNHMNEFRGLLTNESGQPVSEGDSQKYFIRFVD